MSRTRASAGPDWDAATGHHRQWLILVVLAAVAFMAQLDLFIVNVAMPAISASYGGASLTSLSWVLNAYAIAFATLLVPAGRLADHFGRRRLLLTGLAIFVLASVVCAVAPTLAVLVVARIAQAVGAAAIVPASLGLLVPVFPAHRHQLAVGIWAGVAAVAAAAGPPVGGLLVSIDWRWIFIINVPIGLAAFVLGTRVLPEVRANRDARLPETVSTVSLLAAVSLLILVLVEGPDWGWSSAAILVLLAVTVAAVVVTVRRSLRSPRALVEAALFRSREFALASIALFLFFVGFATWLLTTVLLLQVSWHYSALRSGLAIAPAAILAAVFAVSSAAIIRRCGRLVPTVVGAVLVAAAAVYWLVVVTPAPSYVTDFLPGLIVAGIGAGLVQAPLFAAASTLPADRVTTGSAVLNMARQVGSAVGVALVALISPGQGSFGAFDAGWIVILVGSGGTALTLLAGRAGTSGLRHRAGA